ncbi:MAG TPA: 4-hydroxyphenylacetate 3-hydroxylase N-terminal domain-containing protein, partial [Candidatus Binatia bacterium]
MPARTGAAYIRALRDGREVWHAGRRIEDVTAHSGFTGTIKTLADLYDKQHASEFRDLMTFEQEGDRSSYSYLAPKNAKQLTRKRKNIEFWAQETFGQMGRYPDFCAQLVVGLLDWTHAIEKHSRQW